MFLRSKKPHEPAGVPESGPIGSCPIGQAHLKMAPLCGAFSFLPMTRSQSIGSERTSQVWLRNHKNDSVNRFCAEQVSALARTGTGAPSPFENMFGGANFLGNFIK